VKTLPETIYLLIGLFLIVSILSVMVVFLYMAYFCMDKILQNLGNSHAVIIKKGSLGIDPISRLLLMNCISTLFIFSRQSLKCGDLSLEDYRNFPVGLKRTIESCGILMVVLSVLCVIFVVFGNYQRWA